MDWIQYLIYGHAGFGGLALLCGLISISVKKGGPVHRKAGKVFFYSMLISALLALIVSLLPEHESPFLFSVGVFSSYFLLSGYRSLKFKNPNIHLSLDRLLAWIIFFTGFGMITYPIYVSNSINIVLTVFGVASIIFGFQDLRLFRNREKLKKSWLKSHLGKMMGAYISAVTAFVVVNQLLPGVWAWFGPSIPGTFYIVYWMRKVGGRYH
ncbi:MAG: DUF2306 domain-containing protein [Crocinitomicaceae bacterium]|nr:DUF2306 domain-containing protein [Crocinitomicaceae bacterium]